MFCNEGQELEGKKRKDLKCTQTRGQNSTGYFTNASLNTSMSLTIYSTLKFPIY